MIYLCINGMALIYYCLMSRYKSKFVFYMAGVIAISLIPAFQYGIGTDYFSYRTIFQSVDTLNYYYRTGEVFFYYFTLLVRQVTSDPNMYFLSVAMLQSVLINIIFYKLNNKNYNLGLVFLLFACVTNLMHLQMNVIRASVAIYLFILAVISKSDGKYLQSLMLAISAVLFHQSALFVIPVILIPKSIYRNLLRYGPVIIVSTLFLQQLDIISIARELIEVLVPKYSAYLINNKQINPSSMLNIFTKAYYFPALLYSFMLIKKRKINLTDFDAAMCGVCLITANLYLFIGQLQLISRINIFFVFFYIFPLYYLFIYLSKNKIHTAMYVIYIIFPYIIKVCMFPAAEFLFKTYIF